MNKARRGRQKANKRGKQQELRDLQARNVTVTAGTAAAAGAVPSDTDSED